MRIILSLFVMDRLSLHVSASALPRAAALVPISAAEVERKVGAMVIVAHVDPAPVRGRAGEWKLRTA
jgi:hypothetical protein